MALSTANTVLKIADTQVGTYAVVADITNYPDIFSAPNKLDSSHLGLTKMKTNILGLQEAPDFSFEALYDSAKFTTIAGKTGTKWFHLEFGTAGANGIFEWSGEVAVYVNGAGVDEVRKMTVVTSCATEVTKA